VRPPASTSGPTAGAQTTTASAQTAQIAQTDNAARDRPDVDHTHLPRPRWTSGGQGSQPTAEEEIPRRLTGF
jgi:hypothetical protein